MNADEEAHPTNSGWAFADSATLVVERCATFAACIFLALIGGIVVVSTLGRTLFHQSVPDYVTISGLLMVAVVALPLAEVQARRTHLIVTVLSDRLPAAAQGWLVLLSDFLSLLFFGALALAILVQLPSGFGFHYGGLLNIPVWPMKALFGFAMLLFALRLVLSLIAGIRAALK
ncbi:MAG: TRAP transporter small permease [Rhodovibrionaceae bacterium]